MIIHCSKKLAAKLADVSPTPRKPVLSAVGMRIYSPSTGGKCVMFCHDASRYTLFLPGLCKEHFAELGGK